MEYCRGKFLGGPPKRHKGRNLFEDRLRMSFDQRNQCASNPAERRVGRPSSALDDSRGRVDGLYLIGQNKAGDSLRRPERYLERPGSSTPGYRANQENRRSRIVARRRYDDRRAPARLLVTHRRSEIDPDEVTGVGR
jgi:hypothetical protein